MAAWADPLNMGIPSMPTVGKRLVNSFAFCGLSRKYEVVVTGRASRNPVQVLLSGSALSGLLLIAAAAPAWDLGEAKGQQTVTTLYLDSATASPGAEAATQLVLFLAPADSLVEFEAEIAYNPALLTPLRAELSPGWQGPTNATLGSDGIVRISGRKTTASCTGGATCLLGTVSWRTMGEGTSPLNISASRLVDEAGELLEAGTSDGSVSVTTGGQPGTSGDGPGGSVGISDAAVGMGVLLLAGAAVSLPILVWHRRRLRPVPSSPAPVTDGLASAVSQYLSSYESAGWIDEPVDAVFERLAQFRAGANVEGTPGNGTATMLHRPPQERSKE